MSHNNEVSERLWRRVRFFAPLLVACPFVRMIAVCNSLAFGTATADSDIDLFVVTAPGRLYTTRFFMKLFTHIFGVRAHGYKTAGRFCQSFFVTENALSLRKIALDFDPHLAEFVATMNPIFGLLVYEKFMRANEAWVKNYLIGETAGLAIKVAPRKALQLISWVMRKVLELMLSFWPSEAVFSRFLLKRDEAFLAKCRAQRDKRGEMSVCMNSEMFKFHVNDTRREIAARLMFSPSLHNFSNNRPNSKIYGQKKQEWPEKSNQLR